jgi:hypothetical protein
LVSMFWRGDQSVTLNQELNYDFLDIQFVAWLTQVKNTW